MHGKSDATETIHDLAGDEAIEWFVRLRANEPSDAEKEAFTAWLARDARNAAAFEDVLQMCGHLAGMDRLRQAAAPCRAKRRLAPAAAGILVAAALALGFGELSSSLFSDHHAAIGERKLVVLEDDSLIDLDSGASINVRYSLSERRIRLTSGEAWFRVSPNPKRPFVVEARDGTVTALGTAFDVDVEQSSSRVTVTEHRVVVASSGRSIEVGEGQQSVFGSSMGVEPPSSVNIKQATAWRRNKIIVEKRPLAEVLARIGRRHRGLIYCVGAAACTQPVTGVFGAEDPLQSLQEIEEALGLKAVYVTRYLIFMY
jgi:transmembrane sensor